MSARLSLGPSINGSYGGETCRRHEGKLEGGASGAGAATTGLNCGDGGPGGPREGESNLSAGIWIGDSDSEYSRSEKVDSASETGCRHDDDFAF